MKHPQHQFAEKARETTSDGKAKSLLRRPQVEARTGLSRSTIYDWMKRGEFPKPVRLGSRLVAWRESDVNAWLEQRQAA